MTVRGRLAHVQAGPRRRRRLPTATLPHAGRDDGRRGADGVRRRRAAARLLAGRGAGRRPAPVLGRVCMDQLVVDLGDDDVATGDEVVLFGTGADGEPTAQDWAEACDTIGYEIVTRMGAKFLGRMPRCMWTPTRRKVRTGEEGTPARAGGSGSRHGGRRGGDRDRGRAPGREGPTQGRPRRRRARRPAVRAAAHRGRGRRHPARRGRRIAPYEGSTSSTVPTRRRWCSCTATPQPRLLALPAARLPRQRRMVFFDQRSHGRSDPAEHGDHHASSSAATSRWCSTSWCRRRSCSSATPWAA